MNAAVESGRGFACYHCTELCLNPATGHHPNPCAQDSIDPPLLHACRHGTPAVLLALLAAPGVGSPDTQIGGYFPPPLHVSAAEDAPGSMLTLLEAGATIDLAPEDYDGLAPLHFACEERRVACARVLLEAGASPDVRASSNMTPLFSAIEGAMAAANEGSAKPDDPERLQEVVEVLLEYGAQPDLMGGSGVRTHTLCCCALWRLRNQSPAEKPLAMLHC